MIISVSPVIILKFTFSKEERFSTEKLLLRFYILVSDQFGMERYINFSTYNSVGWAMIWNRNSHYINGVGVMTQNVLHPQIQVRSAKRTTVLLKKTSTYNEEISLSNHPEME